MNFYSQIHCQNKQKSKKIKKNHTKSLKILDFLLKEWYNPYDKQILNMKEVDFL